MVQSFFKTRDGVHLFYSDIGIGYPIVFLHGNNLSQDYFKNQLGLSKHYRLILIDSRGHGKSGFGEHPISFAQLSVDIEELLTFLEIKKCVLVGHSDGANLALTYSKLFLKRVEGVLFNGGNIRFRDLRFISQITVWIEIYFFKFISHFTSRLMRRYEIVQLMLDDLELTQNDISHFEMPITVVIGSRDLVRMKPLRELVKRLPQGKFVLIRGAGHNPAKTHPMVFNTLVSDLVSSIGKEGQ